MNDLQNLLNLPSHSVGELPDTPELHLRAVSILSSPELLPRLLDAIDRANSWILHRQMISASTLQMRIETQGRFLIELYGSLLEQGMELSRDSHRQLTERCSCACLDRNARGSITTVRLTIELPAEAPLPGCWKDTCIA